MKTTMPLFSTAPIAISGLAVAMLVCSTSALSQPVPLGAPVMRIDQCGDKGWCYVTVYPDGSREARANPVADISYPPAGVSAEFVVGNQQTGVEINEADLLGVLSNQRLMIQNNP
jgi:hypothetical protein